MNYYVYLIISKKNNKYYTYVGYTSNINKRLRLHNSSKGAKYTRGKNWIIVYKKKYDNKSQAMKNEFLLKKNKQKRKQIKENFIKKNENFNIITI